MSETAHDDKVVPLNPTVTEPTKGTDQSHPAEPQAPVAGEPSASTSDQNSTFPDWIIGTIPI